MGRLAQSAFSWLSDGLLCQSLLRLIHGELSHHFFRFKIIAHPYLYRSPYFKNVLGIRYDADWKVRWIPLATLVGCFHSSSVFHVMEYFYSGFMEWNFSHHLVPDFKIFDELDLSKGLCLFSFVKIMFMNSGTALFTW